MMKPVDLRHRNDSARGEIDIAFDPSQALMIMPHFVRCLATAGVVLFATLRVAWAEEDRRVFLGVVAGISTLSADASTLLNASRFSSSSYDPENGPGVEAYIGVHFNQYFSAQLKYSWDRHDIRLSGIQATLPPDERLGMVAFYEQSRSSSQQTLIANVLLYFRDRPSWARPYLAVGTGAATLTSTSHGSDTSPADAPTPPARFSSVGPALEAAVGIDLRIRRNWGFRYSFAETIRGNPIGEQLTPPGTRPLATFRNLFGFIKLF